MISDVDAALSALLREEVLRGQSADIAFDAPTTEWAARRNGPVVDVFMYDIREDVERRDAAAQPVRDQRGRITGHRPGPRYFRLSYLLTAWTSRPEDEHHLLGQMLENLVRFDRIPAAHLSGRLADEQVVLQVALPPGRGPVADRPVERARRRDEAVAGRRAHRAPAAGEGVRRRAARARAGPAGRGALSREAHLA